MSRSRIYLLALLGVAIALTLWILRDGRIIGPDRRDRGRPANAEVGHDAPLLRGAKEQTLSERRHPPPEPSGETPGAATTDVVRVTVHGIPPRDLPAAKLTAEPMPDGESVEIVTWDASGALAVSDDDRLELNVTELVRSVDSLWGFDLLLDHPSYVPVAWSAQASRAAPTAAGEPRVHQTEIRLVSATVVHGLCLDSHRRPVEAATVALFSMTAGVPDERCSAMTTTDQAGRYRLRSPQGGAFLLTAHEKETGHGWAQLEVAAREHVEAEPLILGAGSSIRGQVLREGRPQTGSFVECDVTGGGTRISFGCSCCSAQFRWLDGALHMRSQRAETDAMGRYELRGLLRRPYRVRVAEMPGVHLHEMEKREGWREVRAPASSIDFDVACAQLVVETRPQGEPLAGATVYVQDLGGDPDLSEVLVWSMSDLHTDETGSASLLVSPERKYLVTVRAEGFEGWIKAIVTPEPGDVRFVRADLKLKAAKGRLRVLFQGLHGRTPRQASFGLYEEGAGPQEHTPLEVRELEGEGGVFLLSDLDSGTYDLHVRPGTSWWGGAGHWMQQVVKVTVPQQGTSEVRVPVRLGGRLRVSIRNANGARLPANCVVRDHSGARVEVSFCATSTSGTRVISGVSLPAEGPAAVVPAMEVGLFTLELTMDGYEPLNRRVDVKLDRTTTVEVVMKRSGR